MKQGFMGDQPGGHGGADDLSGAALMIYLERG